MTTAPDSDRARPEPAARSVHPARPADTVLSVLRNPRLLLTPEEKQKMIAAFDTP